MTREVGNGRATHRRCPTLMWLVSKEITSIRTRVGLSSGRLCRIETLDFENSAFAFGGQGVVRIGSDRTRRRAESGKRKAESEWSGPVGWNAGSGRPHVGCSGLGSCRTHHPQGDPDRGPSRSRDPGGGSAQRWSRSGGRRGDPDRGRTRAARQSGAPAWSLPPACAACLPAGRRARLRQAGSGSPPCLSAPMPTQPDQHDSPVSFPAISTPL